MSRRGKTFGECEEQLYTTLYEQTRLERERAFQRSGRPPRRRSLAGRAGGAGVDMSRQSLAMCRTGIAQLWHKATLEFGVARR